jgi:hypothetical protein
MITNTDEIEMFFDSSDSTSFLESLSKCRKLLADSASLACKLDAVIHAELDLALMGAEKAKSEILKKDKENTVRPIK